MEHNYIDLTLLPAANHLVIHQRDNNIDKIDNLDTLPNDQAVFAICGRVNGKPANTRYVGVTENLKLQIKAFFDKNADEPDECFKAFMHSIKTKELIYEIVPKSTPEELADKKQKWRSILKPNCNEELNKVH